jgi:hypothetical protein
MADVTLPEVITRNPEHVNVTGFDECTLLY